MNLETLKEKLKLFEKTQNYEKIKTGSESQDIFCGTLNQISGHAARHWISTLLLHNPMSNVAWLESQLQIFPTALYQQNINLSKILFIESQTQTDWTLLQLLKSGLFQIIILPIYLKGTFSEERHIRRFQLLAQSSKSTVFFISRSQQSNLFIKSHIHLDNMQSIHVFKKNSKYQ